MTQLEIVTGAGPVGWTVAEQLADQGRRVRILTRSGSGPEHPLVERMKVDVSDPAAIGEAFDGATAIYHCIHGSKYSADAWTRELPVAEQIVMDAAGKIGAVVVFPESLYSYDSAVQPMTETGPRNATAGKPGVRAELLRARSESATHTVSVVASDFFGPHVRTAMAGERMVPAVLAGKAQWLLGSADTPHSFTYVPDLAAAMIAAAHDRTVWDRILHAPTNPAVTQRAMVEAFAVAGDVRVPKVTTVPSWALRGVGRIHGSTRELAEMLYQFDKPFVMSSADSENRLGIAPTPLSEATAATVAWWREQEAAGQTAA